VLHIFLLSRVFLPDGWRDDRDIASWLAATYSPEANSIDTAAGPVALWLLDPETATPAGDCFFTNLVSMFEDPRPVHLDMEGRPRMGHRSLDAAQTQAVDALMQSVHARYTVLGACTLVPRADGPQAHVSLDELCGRSAARSSERDFFWCSGSC
jgi:hypothetical protein